MSKARDIADLGAVTSRLDTVGASDGALSNRNMIMNGAMQVAQRGTSFNVGTSTIYGLDRFQFATGSSFDFDITGSQSTDAPSGFANSLKCTPNTTQTPSDIQNCAIRTNFEGFDLQRLGYGTSDAKKMTLSFYVKSNKTGTYSVQFIHQDGSGKSCVINYTIDSSNTWERKTMTIEPDTSNAYDNNNALSLILAWHLACGSSDIVSPSSSWGVNSTGFRAGTGQVNFMDATANEWYITGIQLEVGDTGTPFEHRSYSDELQRCMRYYQANDATGNNNGFVVTEYSNNFRGRYLFPVTMRANPTVTTDFSGATIYDSSTSVSASFFGTDNQTTTGFRLSGNTGGVSTVGYINSWGWAADAEL